MLGSLTANPSTTTVGSIETLTAGSVADPDGTVANVAFYAESNGVAGLQTGPGGDTRLATDATSPYQAQVNTTGKAAGAYTYYAVATDDCGATSAVKSTSITLTRPLKLSIGRATATERNTGTPVITFSVSLSAPSTQPVTVKYATANGTATAGVDYKAVVSTLTFAPGEVSKTIPVAILADTIYEADEDVLVNLSGATNAVIVAGQGRGVILDDDAAPTLKVSDVSVREMNRGTTKAAFRVSLSAASGLPVTFSYATADGAGRVGSDYSAAKGTVTIPPGATSATINVPILGDTIAEVDESFFVNLIAPTGATIADGQGLGKILNDENQVSIGDVTSAEGNSGTTPYTFTVWLSAPASFPIAVGYRTHDGTATAASGDYAAASGTLTFRPGEMSKTVTVLVKGDTPAEANEAFTLHLSSPTNATISRGTATATIVNDDMAAVLTLIPPQSPTEPAPRARDAALLEAAGLTHGDDPIGALARELARFASEPGKRRARPGVC